VSSSPATTIFGALNTVVDMSNAIEPINWADSSDGDSGYNESQMSTASVTSSVFAYEQENGRTYHAFKAGKYVMPNDEGEQERMDSKMLKIIRRILHRH
jgi:hypothetical protein